MQDQRGGTSFTAALQTRASLRGGVDANDPCQPDGLRRRRSNPITDTASYSTQVTCIHGESRAVGPMNPHPSQRCHSAYTGAIQLHGAQSVGLVSDGYAHGLQRDIEVNTLIYGETARREDAPHDREWSKMLEETLDEIPSRSPQPTVLAMPTGKTQWRPTEDHQQDPRTDNEVVIACALRDLVKEMAQLKAGAAPPQEEPDFRFGRKPTEDPEKYLDLLEGWLQRYPTSRYAQVAYRTLEADAHDWFRAIHFAGMEWNLFVAQFVAKYDSPAIRATLMRELYGRAQGLYEDAYSFVMNKWSLFVRLRPDTTPPECLQTVQELLLPRVRAITRGTTFLSLQHLLEIVTQIEADLREEQHRLRPPQSQMRREGEAPSRPTPAKPVTDRSPPTRPSNPCFFCRGDHFNRDCPQRPGKATRAGAQTSTRLDSARLNSGRASQPHESRRNRDLSNTRPPSTTP